MEAFMDFLRQNKPSTSLNTGDVMLFMLMMIAMCFSSWGPLFSKKPANGHDDHNPDDSSPRPPPANN